MLADEDKSPRELLKLLPVLFITANIVSLYAIYVSVHCWPLLQVEETRETGIWQLAVFNVVTLLLIICYIRSILTHPGTIPDASEDPSWSYSVPLPSVGTDLQWQESKKSGERRHCKWCTKYKPDRCHHCRVCQQCILKMDHHCPWIYNCVGFGNHKYFFLLLLYTTIDTHFITWTMLESVENAIEPSTPFDKMFLLLLGETLAALLAFLVTIFYGFHIYLMLNAMTTIEFCEKAIKRQTYVNVYDRGFCGNLRSVLGEYTFLWLLPLSPPVGNGLTYAKAPTEETPFVRDLETGRGIKSWEKEKISKYKQRRRVGAGTGAAPESELESEGSV